MSFQFSAAEKKKKETREKEREKGNRDCEEGRKGTVV